MACGTRKLCVGTCCLRTRTTPRCFRGVHRHHVKSRAPKCIGKVAWTTRQRGYRGAAVHSPCQATTSPPCVVMSRQISPPRRLRPFGVIFNQAVKHRRRNRATEGRCPQKSCGSPEKRCGFEPRRGVWGVRSPVVYWLVRCSDEAELPVLP